MRKFTILLLAALITPALANLADASSRIEKNLKLEPKGRFVLDSDVGGVTLTGASSSGARVVITSDRDDFDALYYVNFEENPGSASVRCAGRTISVGASIFPCISKSKSPPRLKPKYGPVGEASGSPTCAATLS